MERSEKAEGQHNQTGGATRREFFKLFGATAALSLCPRIEETFAQNPFLSGSQYEKGWNFSLKEMQRVYEHEYNSEKILKNTIKNVDGKWVGTILGQHYEVSQKFIDTTVSHIQELFDRRFIRFLFRLDASHAHAFIPKEHRARYNGCSPAAEAQIMAHDSSLGILFHTAEHLGEDPNDPEVVALNTQRNFIGWYDGRDMSVLPLPHYTNSKTTAVNAPGQLLRPGPLFAAHKDGVFSIIVEGKEIHFDISLDDSTYY